MKNTDKDREKFMNEDQLKNEYTRYLYREKEIPGGIKVIAKAFADSVLRIGAMIINLGSMKNFKNSVEGIEINAGDSDTSSHIDDIFHKKVIELLMDLKDKTANYSRLASVIRRDEESFKRIIESIDESLEAVNMSAKQGFTDVEMSKAWISELEKIQGVIKPEFDAAVINICMKKLVTFIFTKEENADSYRRLMDEVKGNKSMILHLVFTDAKARKTGIYADDYSVYDGRDYDFNLHHPDMIYTDNPYDYDNSEAGLDEKFSIKNLQQHTGRLIFIDKRKLSDLADDNAEPAGKESDGSNAIKAGLLNMPTAIGADHILVTCSELREAYIEEFMKLESGFERSHWEEMIEIFE